MLKSVLTIASIFVLCTCLSQAQSDAWEDGGYEDNWGNGGYEDNWGNGGYEDNWGNGGYEDNQESLEGEGYQFASYISESSDALVEEDSSTGYRMAVAPMAAIPGGSKNLFWIVSQNGRDNWRSINIPLYRYARLLLIPSSSGNLVIEERYPNGQVRSYNFGNVRANRQYRMWFYADTAGTHQDRYRIGNGPYSDILTFNVYATRGSSSSGSGWSSGGQSSGGWSGTSSGSSSSWTSDDGSISISTNTHYI